MIRRTPLSDDGQPASDLAPAYGILDPSNNFHRCADAQCTNEKFEEADV